VRARAVLVGVDGSATSRRAVSFAAAEAARRRAQLHLLHVQEIVEPSPALVDATIAWALREAGAHLDSSHVVTSTVPGSAVEVLQDRSRDAQLVVVGRGEPGPLGELFGSVPLGLVGHVTCPVAVIGTGPVEERNDVIVGVRRFEEADRLLETAFAEAQLRHVPLRVWHLWSNPEPEHHGDVMFPVYDAAAYGRERAERLRAAVGVVARDYPRVMFTCEVRHKSAARSLTAAADGASLLVLGAPHRGALVGLLARTTGRSLLRHANCPVLFVPTHPAPQPRRAGDGGATVVDGGIGVRY